MSFVFKQFSSHPGLFFRDTCLESAEAAAQAMWPELYCERPRGAAQPVSTELFVSCARAQEIRPCMKFPFVPPGSPFPRDTHISERLSAPSICILTTWAMTPLFCVLFSTSALPKLIPDVRIPSWGFATAFTSPWGHFLLGIRNLARIAPGSSPSTYAHPDWSPTSTTYYRCLGSFSQYLKHFFFFALHMKTETCWNPSQVHISIHSFWDEHQAGLCGSYSSRLTHKSCTRLFLMLLKQWSFQS